MSRPPLVRAGDRFGALTVIGESSNTERHRKWKCRCDCGELTEVYQHHLLSGEVRSCGCRRESKYQQEQYYELAERYGITWIGKELPTNTHSPTLWRCEHGHQFSRSYNSLLSARNICPECYRLSRVKQEEDYHNLAYSRGFRWLGDKVPPNTLTPTLWSCGAGHKWQARYNAIQRGTGCPECYRLSRRKG